MLFALRLCAIWANQKQKGRIFLMRMLFSLHLSVISENQKHWEKYLVFRLKLTLRFFFKFLVFWLKLTSSRKVRFSLHIRVGFCVLCFVGKKSFLKASTQTKAAPPPSLSLSLSQIFCIDQLVQSYFKRVEVLGSSLHFVGADFFIPAHSRTLPATSTIFFQKAITSSSGSRFF